MTTNATERAFGRSPRDPWRAFDALPRPIRDALQDGVSPMCPGKVRAVFRALRREVGETEAITRLVARIEAQQAARGWAGPCAARPGRTAPREIKPVASRHRTGQR